MYISRNDKYSSTPNKTKQTSTPFPQRLNRCRCTRQHQAHPSCPPARRRESTSSRSGARWAQGYQTLPHGTRAPGACHSAKNGTQQITGASPGRGGGGVMGEKMRHMIKRKFPTTKVYIPAKNILVVRLNSRSTHLQWVRAFGRVGDTAEGRHKTCD